MTPIPHDMLIRGVKGGSCVGAGQGVSDANCDPDSALLQSAMSQAETGCNSARCQMLLYPDNRFLAQGEFFISSNGEDPAIIAQQGDFAAFHDQCRNRGSSTCSGECSL